MNARFAPLETTQLEQAAQPKRWVWDGLLGPGQITLFTSVWKSGKTTLLAHLLAQRKTGGMLAGRAVAQGVSAIVTEEPPSLWQERSARLGFGPRNCFLCRPFVGTPSLQEWQELLDCLRDLARARALDLVVIDPLAYFLPAREENHARLLLEALLPLRGLVQAGIAVLLLHHPRKAPGPEGMASRGSGVLPAFVDVLVEMYPVKPNDVNDRRRRLIAFSRDPATPRSLSIELNADGSGYHTVASLPEDDEFNQSWQVLRLVFEDAAHELTRQEILAQWPTTYPAPNAQTLWRWLTQAQQRGLIATTGNGRRADPYRYFLPEKLAQWQTDPMWELARQSRQACKDVFAAFGPPLGVGPRRP
jgi:hypothetical protein